MFVVHDMKNKCSTEPANHAAKLQKLWLNHALTVIVKKTQRVWPFHTSTTPLEKNNAAHPKVSICNH